MKGNLKKCPYESSQVECARCGEPYNVDGGIQSLVGAGIANG